MIKKAIITFMLAALVINASAAVNQYIDCDWDVPEQTGDCQYCGSGCNHDGACYGAGTLLGAYYCQDAGSSGNWLVCDSSQTCVGYDCTYVTSNCLKLGPPGSYGYCPSAHTGWVWDTGSFYSDVCITGAGQGCSSDKCSITRIDVLCGLDTYCDTVTGAPNDAHCSGTGLNENYNNWRRDSGVCSLQRTAYYQYGQGPYYTGGNTQATITSSVNIAKVCVNGAETLASQTNYCSSATSCLSSCTAKTEYYGCSGTGSCATSNAIAQTAQACTADQHCNAGACTPGACTDCKGSGCECSSDTCCTKSGLSGYKTTIFDDDCCSGIVKSGITGGTYACCESTQCWDGTTCRDNGYSRTEPFEASCIDGAWSIPDVDTSMSSCNGLGYKWLTGEINGSNGACCGNNGVNDEFFNGSISDTTFFCHEGQLVKQPIDANKTLCESYFYSWLDGSVTGVNGSCCGDDGVNDNFNNGIDYCNNGVPERTIITSFQGASLSIQDLNGDTCPDVLSAGSEGIVYWPSDCSKGFGAKHSVTLIASSSASVGDLNGDSCPDIVSAEENTISYYAGNCAGSFSSESIIKSSFSASSVLVIDANHDGHNDVMAVSDTGIYCWLAKIAGASVTWTQVVIEGS